MGGSDDIDLRPEPRIDAWWIQDGHGILDWTERRVFARSRCTGCAKEMVGRGQRKQLSDLLAPLIVARCSQMQAVTARRS